MSLCGQVAGEKKVFKHGDSMLDIMENGNYKSVPMFGGANRDEGISRVGGTYYEY